MTSDQLQAAQAAHWRQKQNPLLTLDDAQDWLASQGLCLYLPRRTQLPAPAPSFVEACMGIGHATPGAAAIEPAQSLMARLTASRKVVALNLLGTVSEQPDFLAHIEVLPYVVCLRADSDWKQVPKTTAGHKVSPLALELWKVLDQAGGMTAAEAREILGRELSESAVLRALSELWQGLRISPVWAETGQAPRWELLRLNHKDALSRAKSTSQVTALSLLVSLYLQSVYAATSEEIEIFLSPLASRSRVREAVRGLSATRQVLSLSMEAQTYFFLEGGLPEFAEAVPPVAMAEPIARPRTLATDQPAYHPLPASRAAKPPTGPPQLRAERARPGGRRPPMGPPSSDRQGARPAGRRPPTGPPSFDREGARPAGRRPPMGPPSFDREGARPAGRRPPMGPPSFDRKGSRPGGGWAGPRRQ
ncbi:MAG: hypothetical protein WA510_32895, partial [Acidobacteriaceae bacterium]